MKFSDIDFNALSEMMNNMSDEEKESLNQMADSMMQDYQNKQNAETEPEEETDFYDFLQIDETEYADLPGNILDEIEAAVDFETFYEETTDLDFSASVLFYAKAVLNLLRTYQYDALAISAPVQTTTLLTYLNALTDEKIHALADAGTAAPQDLAAEMNLLRQLYILLNRAEHDSVSYEELQAIKEELFAKKGLLDLVNVIQKE